MKDLILTCLLPVLLFPLFVQGQSNQACQLRVEGVVQPPSCQGGMDGAIRLQLRGGTAPYVYHWNSGQDAASIQELTEGNYIVTVRDGSGCEATAEFLLAAKKQALGLAVNQEVAAEGKKVLHVRFAGNAKPYAVYVKKISDGYRAPQVAYTGQALTSGTYLLEAFTAAGCSVSERVRIAAN